MRRLLPAFAFFALLLPAAASAGQDDPRLDGLFDKLYEAEAPIEIKTLEQAIWTLWLETPSPTVELLMGSGMEAMQAREYAKALSFFNVVVEFAPDYAEGWNKRATLHFLMGNNIASRADIQKTLALEPRHFGALSGLATILEAEKDYGGALTAMERAVSANPHLPGARDQLKILTRRARGEPI